MLTVKLGRIATESCFPKTFEKAANDNLEVEDQKSSLLKRFAKDERGAAAAEYALLLAIIAAGLAVAAQGLGTAITNVIDNTATCIADPSIPCS